MCNAVHDMQRLLAQHMDSCRSLVRDSEPRTSASGCGLGDGCDDGSGSDSNEGRKLAGCTTASSEGKGTEGGAGDDMPAGMIAAAASGGAPTSGGAPSGGGTTSSRLSQCRVDAAPRRHVPAHRDADAGNTLSGLDRPTQPTQTGAGVRSLSPQAGGHRDGHRPRARPPPSLTEPAAPWMPTGSATGNSTVGSVPVATPSLAVRSRHSNHNPEYSHGHHDNASGDASGDASSASAMEHWFTPSRGTQSVTASSAAHGLASRASHTTPYADVG